MPIIVLISSIFRHQRQFVAIKLAFKAQILLSEMKKSMALLVKKKSDLMCVIMPFIYLQENKS